MNGSELSGMGCLGEGCFSRKERKERKGMEMTEEKAKEVCDEIRQIAYELLGEVSVPKDCSGSHLNTLCDLCVLCG